MKFVSDIRLLLLSIWLGSAVFFIGVAQSAFAVLPQRELAGAVVNRTLSILNYGGIVIAVILILTSLVVSKNFQMKRLRNRSSSLLYLLKWNYPLKKTRPR
jgi:hypothetical protein